MSEASRNAISSPGSEAGLTRSSSPDGESDLFGQALAPASRSVQRVKGKPKMTRGISGRTGFGSFASAALSESLASRLQTALGRDGSTLFRQTWKRKATPLGRLFWAHTASGLHTSGNGSGSWPTPNAIPEGRGGLRSNPEKALERRAQGHMLNLDDAATLAAWATPKVATGDYQYTSGDHSKIALNLSGQVKLVTGSPAKTESRAQLNPAHSRWLMGYPNEWDACAGMEMPSSRRSRRNSSKPTWKSDEK